MHDFSYGAGGPYRQGKDNISHELKKTKGADRLFHTMRQTAHGKTSCRGNKGANSRSGTNRRLGFEGGQMPLMRRVPKRGFNSKFPVKYQIVNLIQLNVFKENETITPDLMKKKDVISSLNVPVKILGNGEIKKALIVSAHKFSKSAAEKLEKAGGKAQIIKELVSVTSIS